MIGIAGRVIVWLASLLLSLILFSLLYLFILIGPGHRLQQFPFIFRLAAILAGPAWFAFLPLVVAIRSPTGWRFWAVLITGILVGPATLPVGRMFGLPTDPLLGGLGPFFIPALIVGSLTTAFYLLGVKAASRGAFSRYF